MKVAELVEAMERIAPCRYAESWDNVGLLAGATDWPAERILLTIDLTERVMQEGLAVDAQAIVAYHPPIFDPLRSITDVSTTSRILLTALEHRIAIYSPHTALDAAPGGVNDWLADALGAGDVRALTSYDDLPRSEECKLVTFCPADAVDRVRNALASNGAGRIGEYEQCSFELRGTGTFLGGHDTNPAVGQSGKLERVDEVRLEMVCPTDALALLVTALREFHPYEEPPIEIHPLRARPQRGVGQGRRVTLDQLLTVSHLVERVKMHLGVNQLRVAHAHNAQEEHLIIGLCAGAGGSLLESAVKQGCTLFLTGEMRHHDVLAAQAEGCTVVLAGHTNTERGYLNVLKERLAVAIPQQQIHISQVDADPLRAV